MAHAIDADSTPLQKLAYFMFSTLPQADAIAVTLFLIRWYAGRTKGVTMPKSLREMSLAELRTARKGWEGRTDHGSKLFLQRLDNEISHVEKHGREIADPKSGKRWGRPFGGDAVPLLDPLVLVSPVGMPLTSTDDQEARNLRRDIAYREMLQPGMVPLVGGLSLDGLEDPAILGRILRDEGYRYAGGAEYIKGDISVRLYGEDWVKQRITKNPDKPVELAHGSGSRSLKNNL